MRLHLVDTNPDVVAAMGHAFRSFKEVEVVQGDILAIAHNAVVSPANAFGFMDGGIDRAYLKLFGQAIQSRVQEAIAARPEGHLPVGASTVVLTGHVRIPFLVLAPTMVTPEAIGRENCYRAMRSVLRISGAHEEVGKDVFCPGLGTGVGMVDPAVAAEEMARAFRDYNGTRRSEAADEP